MDGEIINNRGQTTIKCIPLSKVKLNMMWDRFGGFFITWIILPMFMYTSLWMTVAWYVEGLSRETFGGWIYEFIIITWVLGS